MQSGSEWMPKGVLAGVFLLAFSIMISLVAKVATSDGPSSESIALKGRVDMMLYDESGALKDERHFDNLIVDSGLEGVASRIAPHAGSINPDSPFNYIALGTGDTAVAATDTELSAELPFGESYSRLQDTEAQYSDTESGKGLILSVTFLPGQATGTLQEGAVFNASTGGDMLARQTFDEIQKATGDTLTVTWTITLSQT